MSTTKKAPIVGIDLGTTNSLVAAFDTAPLIIPNALGQQITPSTVHIGADDRVRIGSAALPFKVTDAARTLYAAKRFIGRRYNEVFDLAAQMPFSVRVGDDNFAVFDVEGQEYSPQIVSALVLRSLKEDAQRYLREEVKEAVIAVPAYFSGAQVAATKQAAKIAGLSVVRVLPEPVAAAMACEAYTRGGFPDRKVVVVDLGGGTLDVTVLEILTVDGECQFEVLSIAGDGFLGGDDFDRRLARWLMELVEYERDIDLPRDDLTQAIFLQCAGAARHALTDQASTQVRIPLGGAESHLIHEVEITRSVFQALCADLFSRIRAPCVDALKGAGIGAADIDDVILVGGGTLMPNARSSVAGIFPIPPRTLVNPFSAIALGAAAQAAVLGGKNANVLLLDVTPHSLGVELADGSAGRLIEVNTTIPTKASSVFALADADSVEINVVEGEGKRASENLSLARIPLFGLQSRGDREIEVSFGIDANSTLEVLARGRTSGHSETYRVSASGLSPAREGELAAVVQDLWSRTRA